MKSGWLVAISLLGSAAAASCQLKAIGSVPVDQAAVVGAPNTSFALISGRAQLARHRDRPPPNPAATPMSPLRRGGGVLVCQTTALRPDRIERRIAATGTRSRRHGNPHESQGHGTSS